MALIITACTNRKRYAPAENLKAENLPRGTLEQTVNLWIECAQAEGSRYLAKDLYIGRAIKDSLKAATLFKTEPYIMSAGMGLVKPDDKVPSYDLTVQPGSSNSIQSKIVEPIFPNEWWDELTLQFKTPTPIAKLVDENPQEIILIACAEIYAQLIDKDLKTLKHDDIKRVRIFGPQHPEKLSEQIREIIMPYDYRFDGPDGPLRGTRTDFGQRALLHFSQEIWPKIPLIKANQDHHNKIKALMSNMRQPEKVSRTSLSDTEIIELVPNMWERANGKSSLMLRVLRDQELVACEQGRFASLFKVAKERFSL